MNSKITVFNKYPINSPVNLNLFNLPFEIQLMIIKNIKRNQKFTILINSFLVFKVKFNIFKNNKELFDYCYYLIISNDFIKNLSFVKYLKITNLLTELSETEKQVLLSRSCSFLNSYFYNNLLSYLLSK